MYFSRKKSVNSHAWFRKSNEDAGINGDPILPYPPRRPSDFNSEYIRVWHAVNVNSCHHNTFVISILHQVLRLGYSCNWRTNVKMCRALEFESYDLGASLEDEEVARKMRSWMKDEWRYLEKINNPVYEAYSARWKRLAWPRIFKALGGMFPISNRYIETALWITITDLRIFR